MSPGYRYLTVRGANDADGIDVAHWTNLSQRFQLAQPTSSHSGVGFSRSEGRRTTQALTHPWRTELLVNPNSRPYSSTACASVREAT